MIMIIIIKLLAMTESHRHLLHATKTSEKAASRELHHFSNQGQMEDS